MPQMMPLMWFMMLCYSIMLLIITSSFIYFFSLPLKLTFKMTLPSVIPYNKYNKQSWIWMW